MVILTKSINDHINRTMHMCRQSTYVFEYIVHAPHVFVQACIKKVILSCYKYERIYKATWPKQ